MPRVNTDKEAIKEILERGVEKIYPQSRELADKLSSGAVLRIYCGFDPSASSLHVGNAIALAKLAQFQKCGHKIIFLIGSFTGMIGDPTDKSAARKQLSRAEVMANAANFQKQAASYIDFGGENPAELRYNSDWHDNISFHDLVSLSANFTVQQMIQRDMFQKRLSDEKPIFLSEFLYPLAQAYDSVALDVDVEVGGNDQMFNMMCGRDLLKSMKNKEKSVLTMKLLTDGEGKKMGKSEGNIVMLDASAEQMYGQVMSWPDGVLSSAFHLCTFVPWEECERIASEISSGQVNFRDLKMRLAWEITKINHGKDSAYKAQEYFVRTVQNKELPEEIAEIFLASGMYRLIDLVVACGLAASKSEAKRLVEQGGIKIGRGSDLAVFNNPQGEVEVSGGLLIQRGKRQFVKIKD